MRIASTTNDGRFSTGNRSLPDETPLLVTDNVLFRWSRVIQIANLFPVMHTIRALEYKLQTKCRSCGRQRQIHEINRTPLADVRRLLAECSDDKARLVKEAVGILKYRVQYHDLSGVVQDVIR